MKYTVNLAHDARQSFQNQVDWIAVENESPENAVSRANRLLAGIDKLEVLAAKCPIDKKRSLIFGTHVHCLVFEKTYLILRN